MAEPLKGIILNDDVLLEIIRHVIDYPNVLFRLLRISKRVNALTYSAVNTLYSRHNGITDAIIARLPALQNVFMAGEINTALLALTRIHTLHLDMGPVGTTTIVDLSAMHLTKLTVLSTPVIGLPLTLVVLEIQHINSCIGLGPYTNITDLVVINSMGITGHDTLTQLERLHLCARSYPSGDDIATMTRLRDLSVREMHIGTIPNSITTLCLYNSTCELHTCTRLQSLTLNGNHYIYDGLPRTLTQLTMTGLILPPSIRELTNLRSLSLNNLGSALGQHNDIQRLTQLHTIHIPYIYINSMEPFANLRSLSMKNISSACIDSLTLLQNLRSVVIESACSITDTQLAACTSLTSLQVYSKTITSASISQLVNLSMLIIYSDMVMHDFTMLTRLRTLALFEHAGRLDDIRLPPGIDLCIIHGKTARLKYRDVVTIAGAKKKDS